MSVRFLCAWWWGLAALLAAGCSWVPSGRLATYEAQNRTLSEQNKAQLTEIENLKTHGRRIEDKLIQSEEQLAQLERNWGVDRKQLANFRRERETLQDQVGGGGSAWNGQPNRQLAELARRYPNLHHDTQTGVGKLDTDILFDSGDAQIKPDAEQALLHFARLLESPDARDLRVLVVGHTDDLKIARKEVRQRHQNNWALSTARALAVADFLRQQGVREERLGVSGFGGHQPIASNDDALRRRNNRRVEIFVIPPDAPVVGWTESMTSVYR